jgi:hypothetical protein
MERFPIHGHMMKSGSAMNICVKFLNAAGEELSLALDNSLGASDIGIRSSLMRFDRHDKRIGHEQCGVTPVQFLKALAEHLGYRLDSIAPSHPSPTGACGGHPGPDCICEPGSPCDYHAATCITCSRS